MAIIGAAGSTSHLTLDMIRLNKSWLDRSPAGQNRSWPTPEALHLPEKILQFGTGVLLRGLCDYFVDLANEKSQFNGRIVVVKSTSQGSTDPFRDQDGLYTLCVRGIRDGKVIKENRICAAISRVLSAENEWSAILEAAIQPNLEIIISNTTEVGLTLVREGIHLSPPSSFPAKLTAILYQRWRQNMPGLTIIPTELVSDNGMVLKRLIQDISRYNRLEQEFFHWIEYECIFCNSLVDRIVPGHPLGADYQALQAELGYEDSLAIMAEDYRLWAIEGDDRVRQKLTFAQSDPGVIITPDITKYRELKLRLLNGTHTFACGIACLSGITTVREALEHHDLSSFISRLMLQDIVRAIPVTIPPEEITHFAHRVLDRFRNSFVHHLWINITLQYASKMRLRNLPLIRTHFDRHGTIPDTFALGLAAFLRFMRIDKIEEDRYFGQFNGNFYPIRDDQAAHFYELYQQSTSPQELIHRFLDSRVLWGEPLRLPGLAEKIRSYFTQINGQGMLKTLQDDIIASGITHHHHETKGS